MKRKGLKIFIIGIFKVKDLKKLEREIRLNNSILKKQQTQTYSNLIRAIDLIESIEQGIIKSIQEQYGK